MNVRIQSYLYTVATIVLVLVVGGVGRHTWHELRQLHRGFLAARTEDPYASREIESSVRELNGVVLRLSLNPSTTNQARYQLMSQDVERGILARQDTLSTPEQNELMRHIAVAYSHYLAANGGVLIQRAVTAPQPILEMVESNAQPVFKACRALEESERTEQSKFMESSQRALSWIQELLAVMLLLLVVSAATALVAINRGVIDPLRLKLVETRALAARNEKLASLGTLAAGVAHEIRNPLTAINVRLHSLKKNLLPNSSEQEDAFVIEHEIQRLERIVRDFLQFARPAEPKFLNISADSVLSRIQSLFASQLARAGIELKVESVPDLWVCADPHQIEQVLINLVQNAAESMDHGGTVTIRARAGKGRLAGRMQPVFMFEVGDTGIGISADTMRRIFDPFFTTKEEGTGLGLAISLRIIEKHGGTLECRSEVNRGTTFSVLLPEAKPEENNELNS